MSDDRLARHMAAGNFSPDVCIRLQQAACAWLRAEGTVSFEACAGLSPTPAKMARAQRDLYILAAWQTIDAPTDWKKSVVLTSEVKTFLDHIWPLWRKEPDPPAHASELRKNLFLAARAAERAGIKAFPQTAVRLHGIVSNLTKQI